MPLTLVTPNGQSAVFSVIELRIIRHCVKQAMDSMKESVSHLDGESEDAVEIANDLPIYEIILTKINDRRDV